MIIVSASAVLAYLDTFAGQENDSDEVRDFVQRAARFIHERRPVAEWQADDTLANFAEWCRKDASHDVPYDDRTLEFCATICEQSTSWGLPPTKEEVAESTRRFCAKAIRAQLSDSDERKREEAKTGFDRFEERARTRDALAKAEDTLRRSRDSMDSSSLHGRSRTAEAQAEVTRLRAEFDKPAERHYCETCVGEDDCTCKLPGDTVGITTGLAT